MTEIITYNNTDISAEVDVLAATHETYVGGRQADTLELVFDDDRGLWSKWKPAVGDTIAYQNGGAGSGTMFVYEPEITNGLCTIRATSLPKNAKIKRTKSWEQVYLRQFGAEIAERSGLTFELQGLENFYYEYMQQVAESDVAFLRRIAEMEGGGIVIYDKRLIMFKDSELEGRDAGVQLSTLGGLFESKDKSGELYGAAELRSGSYFGRFTADPDNKMIYTPDELIRCTSNAEAYRFAAGILRTQNKDKMTAKLTTDLMPEVTAGVMAELENTIASGWSGLFFLYRVRHEYHNERTVLYMRRPLEGY